MPSQGYAEELASRSAADSVWVLCAAGLVFFMQCGFLCLEVGSVQPRAATITALKNVVDWVISVGAFFLLGWGVMFGHSYLGLFGTDFAMLEGTLPRDYGGLDLHVHFLFQLAFAGTAATIVSGALAERTSFAAYAVVSAAVTILIYPVLGHWVWGKSFFHDNAALLADRGFYDFAGSTVVHSVGGWVSLVGVIMVGPRLGRFKPDGTARELPNMGLHWNAFATLLLWLCWWGFNGGSTLAVNDKVGPIIITTNLGGAFGAAGAIVHCVVWQQRRALSVKFLNGILAGLVSVTASCSIISPASAMVIGFVAGIVANLVAELLLRFRLDDPAGAIPVHLGGGLWGTLATGLFASSKSLAEMHTDRLHQIGAQALGLTVCAIWVLGTSIPLFILIRHYVGLRVSPLEETEGFDLSGVISKPSDADLSEGELLQLLRGDT
ncbi:MAG: hypothetical protein QM778_35370 [Myxococcales bacterium]